MKYLPIDKALFIENRKRFSAHLLPGSLAVFNSNDIMPTSADGTMAFKQSSDIFYLSGIDQEESVLVMFPECHDPQHREILFLKETSDAIAIWEGAKHTKQTAFEASGIKTVYWLNQFERVFKTLMSEAENVYLNTNEHLRAIIEVETREARFIKWVKEHYPAHQYRRSAPVMHALRAVKHSLELEKIQTAINITEKAFKRVLAFVKPGVAEYEIEAEYIHEFTRSRSRGFSYTPIIASGYNACVLHYIDNDQVCKDGDVLLMDVGAEYANYAADMTRCLPVNGKFTPRQKDVYNAVLRVMQQATQLLRPGTMLADYQKEAGIMMERELIKLKLLSNEDVKNQNPEWPAYKKYFMHGTSHFLGLDVHDVGLWNKPIQPGMVFTVEPGIYIREESLGIRLENNILVTKTDPINLMANIPVEADHIEELMNKR